MEDFEMYFYGMEVNKGILHLGNANIRVIDGMLHFWGWDRQSLYNSVAEKPIYTKTQLSKMGLKPKNPNDCQVHMVVTKSSTSSKYYPYNFYTLDNTVPKRSYKKHNDN